MRALRIDGVRTWLDMKYRGQAVQLREWHLPVNFGDVASGMGAVSRRVEPVYVDTVVDGLSIACRPADLDRWLVFVESHGGVRTALGCTDMWPHRSETARYVVLDVPIYLQRGEGFSLVLESRVPEARSVVMQVDGLQVEPRSSYRG